VSKAHRGSTRSWLILTASQETTMNITAELSLYPLMGDYVPTIQTYIDELNAIDSLEVRTNALSTEVFGEYTLVMQSIQALTYTVFCAEPAAVLVAKYVNRDRRDESQT
tara:strand:- start:615 stop:941 length:327 start_codon:yes stop_codon:yes gene_type:complete